jgi:hypothetical protein
MEDTQQENEEFIDQTEIQEELEVGERPEEDDEDIEGEDIDMEDEESQKIEFHDDSIQGFFEHKGSLLVLEEN